MTPTPKPWLSGFCTTYPHASWQRDACHGGYTRTPTKADPRDWVPCACPCHAIPEEPTMTALDPGDFAHADEQAHAAGEPPGEALNPPETDGPPLTLPVAIELAAVVAGRLSTAAGAGAIDALTWEDAIRLLDELRPAIDTLRQVDSLLARRAYLAGPHGKNIAELDGIGLVSIGRTQNRKHWDERGVARAVIDARMADTTGEAPDPWQVAEWLLEVYGVDYCRVTPLRALGIEPAAFCDEEPGNISVQLPKRT